MSLKPYETVKKARAARAYRLRSYHVPSKVRMVTSHTQSGAVIGGAQPYETARVKNRERTERKP